MPTSADPGAALPLAVTNVTVAGQYRFGIVYPRDVSADSDPVADAYRRGDTAGLTALVEVARDLLRPGDRVLDLGAHLGGFALAAASMGCDVIAVEASAELASCVRRSAEHNRLSNLVVVHAAVSDENGQLEFSAHGPWGHVATPRTGHPAKTVPARRVDDLFREHGWDTVHFVKLDVEGSEIRALRGMQQWLDRPDAPPVFFESNRHTLSLYDQDDSALRAVFLRAGYALYRVVASGQLEAVGETHQQTEVCCDYLATKRPLPASLRSWLSAGERVDAQISPPPMLIDWLGGDAPDAAALGGDRWRQSLEAHPDWPSYLAALAHRPLPTALILDTVPPPEAEPFLEWFGQRGVLLGATSALVRRLQPAPAWLGAVRLLLTDREPVGLTVLPTNACLYCLRGGLLPSVPESCHLETVDSIEPALQRQRQRVVSELAAWEPREAVASAEGAAATARPAAAAGIAQPRIEDSREKWLRRALRLVEIPVIGPLLSWAWAVRDLVGTRRKVLRFDERMAAVVEAQSNAGRDLKELGQKLRGLETARGAMQSQLHELQQQWDRRLEQLLMPGAAMPFALQRDLPDQLERARAGLDAQRAPLPCELADGDVSQMWLGELAGPEARAILARQYEAYWPWLERADGPVLDVGCGAGEWLAFLAARGKRVVGIDSNPQEVERCRKGGLDVHCADAFDWLEERRGEYAAITLFQVIEHIPRARLHEFLALLAGALREGGLLVMETVNPAHPLALSIFYNDPTHQRPLPLEYLGFVCQSAGLRPESTVYTYPVSVAVTGTDWQATHYVNYAVILRKP